MQIVLLKSISHGNGSLNCFELWETYTVPNLEETTEEKVGQWVSIGVILLLFLFFIFYFYFLFFLFFILYFGWYFFICINIWQSMRTFNNYKTTALLFLITSSKSIWLLEYVKFWVNIIWKSFYANLIC